MTVAQKFFKENLFREMFSASVKKMSVSYLHVQENIYFFKSSILYCCLLQDYWALKVTLKKFILKVSCL